MKTDNSSKLETISEQKEMQKSASGGKSHEDHKLEDIEEMEPEAIPLIVENDENEEEDQLIEHQKEIEDEEKENSGEEAATQSPPKGENVSPQKVSDKVPEDK